MEELVVSNIHQLFTGAIFALDSISCFLIQMKNLMSGQQILKYGEGQYNRHITETAKPILVGSPYRATKNWDGTKIFFRAFPVSHHIVQRNTDRFLVTILRQPAFTNLILLIVCRSGVDFNAHIRNLVLIRSSKIMFECPQTTHDIIGNTDQKPYLPAF